MPHRQIDIFSTCPPSNGAEASRYLEDVARAARWSDDAGYRGILVYTDNSMLDPWLVAQVIVESTDQLAPLVAVQPIYMHPYTAAKMVASLAFLHHRRIFLNMLAGGFKNDLVALNDETPHDDRYARTVEYTLIIKQLLERAEPLTFTGKYYKVTNLRLTPAVPTDLLPGIVISGSSPAGLAASRAISATAIKYPKASAEEVGQFDEEIPPGIRIGIVARASSDEAWRVALERFPEDRKGQLAHGLAMKVSDSHWHKQLSAMGSNGPSERDAYWLGPFENYKTFCPYLVGDYDRVAREVATYILLGFTTFILDVPPSYEELQHTAQAFERARELVRS